MVLGTLLYAVVLGFFNDYTGVLATKSYSTTFAVAIVMQVLTLATLALKNRVVGHFKQNNPTKKGLMAFCVWLIVFFSKFVFLAVLDVIFGNNLAISGFVGLLLIIVCVTLLQFALKRANVAISGQQA